MNNKEPSKPSKPYTECVLRRCPLFNNLGLIYSKGPLAGNARQCPSCQKIYAARIKNSKPKSTKEYVTEYKCHDTDWRVLEKFPANKLNKVIKYTEELRDKDRLSPKKAII